MDRGRCIGEVGVGGVVDRGRRRMVGRLAGLGVKEVY